MDAALRVEGLACTAGSRPLFADLSLEIADGQWTMLTGANGTGKSTLLRAIAGLVMPERGRVLWRGLERRRGDPSWHASFAYLGHAAGWKDTLDVRENLALQAALDAPGARAAAGARALDEALAAAGLARQRTLAYGRLSAGQRRRLGLARLALLRRPLWLLDEPTTALDAAGQALLARLLDEHLQRGGCALIATHQPLASARPPQALSLDARPRLERQPVGSPG